MLTLIYRLVDYGVKPWKWKVVEIGSISHDAKLSSSLAAPMFIRKHDQPDAANTLQER